MKKCPPTGRKGASYPSLCETLFIIEYKIENLLNQRNEPIPKCLHKNKFKLTNQILDMSRMLTLNLPGEGSFSKPTECLDFQANQPGICRHYLFKGGFFSGRVGGSVCILRYYTMYLVVFTTNLGFGFVVGHWLFWSDLWLTCS